MQPRSRTKIVCTIGPASREPEVLDRLIDAGMNVARLNFSHGNREQHANDIGNLRRLAGRRDRPVAILQDLAGFKIRIGDMADGSARLETGARLVLTTREVPGDAEAVSVSYESFPRKVRTGDLLLLGDGNIELEVEGVSDADVTCVVVVGGELSSRKGVSVCGRTIGASGLTDRDREDLVFGLEQGVDFVALSFVRDAADVREARGFIDQHGHDTPVIAKIETQDAIEGIDDIIQAADGVMVARGDLGVDTPVARIPRLQKMLIDKANRAAKSVITATQMLGSMVQSPRPTRAEVTDVANAILDGTDAVMLSEETAVGDYPVQAVRMMAEIAREAETDFPYDSWLRRSLRTPRDTVSASIATAVCGLAQDVRAAAILTCTSSGSTARSVARCRPRQPVLALTSRDAIFRRLALTWGVFPRPGRATSSTDELIRSALEAAADAGLVGAGDRAVVTAGVPAGTPGHTNLIKVEEWPGRDDRP